MPRLKISCVYDVKVNAYMAPLFFRSTGESLRAFGAACKDPQSNFAKFPTDFTLFEIGEFDEHTCELVPYQAKLPIGTSMEFINKPEDITPMGAIVKGM